ncbi:MAG: hypothetical protein CSA68_11205 [Rhodobacterales bacterium]|nr:MAG: hypothetical protein CSA68_11205 [Rhodobacterales bacterium]
MRESDLYHPVKSYLQAQGYQVKGEVGAVDVVAIREGEDAPVLVELKLAFSLALLHQGIARQAISDAVYLAVPHSSGKALKNNLGLCRRLGLGLMTVRLRDGFVEVLADPVPYCPRKSVKRKTLLLREFARRVGDPNAGGAVRGKVVTSYRQDALRCATYLEQHGPSKGAVVAKACGVPGATRIMRDDHYGWFERVGLGVYQLTAIGGQGLEAYGRVEPES